MTDFTLNQFRDFINSVSDEVFSIKELPKEASKLNNDELQQRILEIIATHPQKNAKNLGARFNTICDDLKAIKDKERIRVALQKIHDAELAAQGKDNRWYLLEKADRRDLQGR